MADTTSLDAVYKRIYRNGIGSTVYGKKSRVLLNWLKKIQGGAKVDWVVHYGDPTGVSHSYANAQTQGATAAQGTKNACFSAVTSDLFGYHTVTDKAILAGKTDAQAFVNTQKHEMDQHFNQIANVVESELIGDGSACLGVVSAINSNTVTLTSRYDVKDIQIGAILQATTAGVTGAVRAGTMTVTSVDRILGTFTCSGGLVGSLAVNDGICFQGNASGSATMNGMAGLKAIIPDTVASSGDSFHTVNRYADRVRLAGFMLDRTTATGGSLDEHLTDFLAMHHDTTDAEPDVLLMSSVRVAELRKVAASKCVVDTVAVKNGNVRLDFQVTKYSGPGFDCDIVTHPKVNDGRIYGLTTDTFEIAHLDKDVVNVNMLDGMKTRALDAAAAQALKTHVYAQLICRDPGQSGVLRLP